MGGHRCCSKQKVKRGLWSPEEDEKLLTYITAHGHGSWSSIPKLAGLQRCGKSCRLRWINYLRPDLKRGSFSAQEEQIIIDVHRILGNRWAQIAKHLPGRTDNEVKNFWNSCVKKKLISQGLDPKTHNLLSSYHRNNSSSKNPCILSQPISVFSVDNNSDRQVKPPIVTLPQPQTQTTQNPVLHQDQYQSPHHQVWAATDHHSNSQDFISFPSLSSIESTPISSSSSPSVNPALHGLGLLDENCIWGGSNGLEPFEQVHPAAGESMGHIKELEQQHPQENNNFFGVELDKLEDLICKDIDASFETSAFELELVEASLMSTSAMYGDPSVAMDVLPWDF